MSNLKRSHAMRVGIWEAYSRKCLYCGEPVAFRDLEIDHILPGKLSECPDEFEQSKRDLGLDVNFELNALTNLAPAHHYCNSAKSDRVFHPARLRYFLEIAASKEAAVSRAIAAIDLRNRKDQLLSAVRESLASGELRFADVANALADFPSLALSSDIEFFDGPISGRIEQDQVEELLDRQVLLGGVQHIDGVDFENDVGQSFRIRTCREYRQARAAGYYALTSFAMKMEAFIGAVDAVLWSVKVAQLPSVSYVSNPFVGIADLRLLPTDLLPSIRPDDEEAILAMPAATSLRDLMQQRELAIIDVSSSRLHFKWQSSGTILTELLRADLDGDGIEELFIQHYTYAIGGTLGSASVGLLRRTDPLGMFQYSPGWRD